MYVPLAIWGFELVTTATLSPPPPLPHIRTRAHPEHEQESAVNWLGNSYSWTACHKTARRIDKHLTQSKHHNNYDSWGNVLMKSQLHNKAKVFCWKKWRITRVIPLPDKPSSVGLVVEAPNIFKFIQKDARGYTWEFVLGVLRPVLKILTLFRTKKCHFQSRFEIRPLKSLPVF